MCVRMFDSRNFSNVLVAGHIRLIGRQFLPISSSLPDFLIGMIIALCHISGICIDMIDFFIC